MCPWNLDRCLDFIRKTRVFKEHLHRNSRGNHWFPLNSRKTMRLHPSQQDEALIPCIGSTAISGFPSNMTGNLSSFKQLQRFPEDTVTSLDEHRG